MPINLSTTIYKDGEIYTGWLNDVKGITAQGESMEEVKAELLELLRIKTEVENKLKIV